MITVKVAGELKGIGEFTPVKVTDLVATTWTMDDRSGVSFRAAKVEVAHPEGVGLMERFFGIVLTHDGGADAARVRAGPLRHRHRSCCWLPASSAVTCAGTVSERRTSGRLNPYSRMALAVRGWGFEVVLSMVVFVLWRIGIALDGTGMGMLVLGTAGIVFWRIAHASRLAWPGSCGTSRPGAGSPGSSSPAR